MNLLSIAAGIMITVILAAASMTGVEALIHGARVSALESIIRHVQQESIQYGQMNGGYQNISCQALVTDNLWLPQGCSNATQFNTEIPVSMSVSSPSPSSFIVSVTDPTGYFNAEDFANICKSFSLSSVCTPAYPTISIKND